MDAPQNLTLRDRYRGALLGLAAGDAVGTTLEFKPRGTFTPIDDMVGGGPFRLPEGAWTDDTSMALCLATSLVEIGAFDLRDQMERYVRWWKEGYLSSTGECFDIGNATSAALGTFVRTGRVRAGSADPFSAGNGSIMRLVPVPMFFYPDVEAAIKHSALSSKTTHGAAECLDACRLFGAVLCRAFAGGAKADVLFASGERFVGEPKIVEIANGRYATKSRAQIRGSGYVVESLEAALWCFYHTDSFRDAVLMAANLGDDADTTAAVVGQIAGAFYGLPAIPQRWLERLVMRDEIERLADQLHSRASVRAQNGGALK